MTLPIITAADLQRYADRQEWLELGRKFIGSSDTAAIVGYSRFRSPVAVWDSKLHPRPDEPTVIQRYGFFSEPFIDQLFFEETGIKTVNPGDYCRYVSKQWEWLACTPDRLTTDGCPVELKTAWFESAKIWKERVPIDYMIQIQHQLAVLDKPAAYVAALLNGSSFKWHSVTRHSKWCDAIVQRTGEFWRDYILTEKMPAIDGSESTRKVLEACYPTHDPKVIDLDDAWTDKAKRWDELHATEKQAKAERDLIGNEVRAVIGDATHAREPEGSGWMWNGKLLRKQEVKDFEQ